MVSVIVPIYNCARDLPRCIESILRQSYQGIEVILVDDGSMDGSSDICDSYAGHDQRIKVIHTPNRGVSAARNIGLRIAKGDFIVFVDSDDYLEYQAVSVLVAGCERTQADLVVGGFRKVKNGHIISQMCDFEQDRLVDRQGVTEYTLSYLLNPRRHQLLMSSWAKLFRSSIVKGNSIWFNEGLRTAEDVAFNFEYLRVSETVCFIKDIVYNHQKSGTYTSLSMRLAEDDPKSLFGYLPALDSVKKFLQLSCAEANVAAAVGHCYVYQVVLFVIRVCGQLTRGNAGCIYRLVKSLISDQDFRFYIKGYRPAPGNYRLVPFLMKAEFVGLVMVASWYEAYKLYRPGEH